MSFPPHLIKVNKRFYFKIKVPVDLSYVFPCKFIKKSLRTCDLPTAKLLLAATESKVLTAFALLRSGVLPHAVTNELLYGMVTKKSSRGGLLLRDMVQKFVAEKQDGWTEKTRLETICAFKLLIDILGNVEIGSITKAMMVDLRSTLQKIPPNFYKKFPNQRIRDVVATYEGTPIDTKTVNKYMGRIGTLLNFCVDTEIISKNPASGLKINEKLRADKERSSYNINDVRKIILNLPFDKESPEKFWIPLIALYTGMRLTEICQLYVDDIIIVDEIGCFNINDREDKRIKNLSSKRIVPIHPILISLGFFNYINDVKENKSPRLWNNLTWNKIHGYSNVFGKWYQRFNRDFITNDPKKVFHSIRHLVTDTLKQHGVLESIIAEIIGHSHGAHSITMGRYGKRYRPKVQLEALHKLDYNLDVLKLLQERQ